MHKKCFLLVISFLLFIACNKDSSDSTRTETRVYNPSGKVQKGPFLSGTTVNIYELNPELNQTGRSFTVQTTSNAGDFALNGIELESNLVLIASEGFYYNELKGEVSQSRLQLQAFTNLLNNEVSNVNVMTHVIRGRIENLVASGMTYEDAYDQAKDELLLFLGEEDSPMVNFEEMDISESDNHDALLLAFSSMVQRYPGYTTSQDNDVAELSLLLSDLQSDFADDGDINELENIDRLLKNISYLVPDNVISNLEDRYSELGMDESVSDFQFYIDKFVQKHDSIYSDYEYPELAENLMDLDNFNYSNLLHKETLEYGNGLAVLAAIVPIGKSLKIKIINEDLDFGILQWIGWHTSFDNDGTYEIITLESQRNNFLMTGMVGFGPPAAGSNSFVVEYYENGSEVPTYSKNVSIIY